MLVRFDSDFLPYFTAWLAQFIVDLENQHQQSGKRSGKPINQFVNSECNRISKQSLAINLCQSSGLYRSHQCWWNPTKQTWL